MRAVRRVIGALVVAAVAVGLSACDSTASDADRVAQTLSGLPSVVSASGSGQGMNLNTDATSEVFVEVEPLASSDQLTVISEAWFEASGELPSTSLRIARASETGVDSELVFVRDVFSEADLAPRVLAWFQLAEAYPRATTVYEGPAGMSSIVTDAATPTGIAGVVDDLRASGVDEAMSWWFYSTEPSASSRFTDGQSFTMFSRNHLPTETLVTLAGGFDEAYSLAGERGGMDLDVSENVDAVTYQATVNVNADSLRELSGEEAVAALQDSDAWAVVQAVVPAIDPTLSIDVDFRLLGGDSVAEINTADCTTQAYPVYEAVGPAVWLVWATYWDAPECIQTI